MARWFVAQNPRVLGIVISCLIFFALLISYDTHYGEVKPHEYLIVGLTCIGLIHLVRWDERRRGRA